MGRRSINTTKSGKYMNPTDQARKEARKRELKKNKKQRMLVRQAVLKGKDPLQLLTEMEIIDKMEYNPVEAPLLNEKVLKDKRRKLKETFQRVVRLYEKENMDYSKELKKAEYDYEKKRLKLQLYFEQVKNAERVQLDQIPLPDIPQQLTIPSMIPLPNEIPLPSLDKLPHGILKKSSGFSEISMMDVDHEALRKRKPPGPPPGPPPQLSDSEDEEYDPEKGIEENIGTVDLDIEHPHDSPDEDDHDHDDEELLGSKSRKIRFVDDDTRDPDEEEKDTRLKFKAPKGVTALQAKMLQMAGQQIPDKKKEAERRRDSSESSSDSDSDEEDRRRRRRRRDDERERDREKRRRDDEDKKKARDSLPDGPPGEDEKQAQPRLMPPGPPPGAPPGAPPGLPPGLPPGPPPGAPPMMFRPMRGPMPRMLPPGPPPGRPAGLPPGPPPGLPPNVRMPPRMPLGPPGLPPHRMLRPPGAPPGMPPLRLAPPGTQPLQNPNVISAQPSIMKPPQISSEEEKKGTATIEAKPQIKNVGGDVTRFTPVALKIKRDPRDAKGRVIKKAKEEEKRISGIAPKSAPVVAATHTKTKDDAYDQFMREMEDLI
ncbi:WW domain-binding protein 11-like [Mytilus edulis]|uniref:WW domain-binding protein 11-like n=1 Tax=Mytilus edulis TaxID=6550 RepID=UPI0039EF9828